MADYDIAHDPKTGQNYVALPGSDQYVPVNEDQLRALDESGPEAFVRSIGNSAGQLLTGAIALTGEPSAREQFGNLAAVQQMRQAGSPWAATAGSLVPDVAIGMATGGTGSIGARLALGGGAEAFLGAARNPDAPLQGAALQGSLGALGVGIGAGLGVGASAVTARMSRPAQRIVSSAEDVVAANRAATAATQPARAGLETGPLGGAPGTAGVEDMVAGSRLRRMTEDLLFPDTDPNVQAIELADELGMRLSPAMRRGNDAMKMTEEAMIRNPGAAGVWNREIAEPNKALVTSLTREAFGIGPGSKITWDDFTKGSDAISAEFAAIADDIPGSYLIIHDDVTQMKNMIVSGTRDARVQEKVYRSWVAPFENAESGETKMSEVLFNQQRLSAQDMWGAIREMNEAIGESSSTAERSALQHLRDWWENRFFGMAGSQGDEMQARIRNVNEKYRVQKLLESQGVLKEDDVNMRVLANTAARQFKSQMMRNDYTDARGRLLQPSTIRFIKALKVIRSYPDMVNNSGTPTGQTFAKGIGQGAAALAGNKVGAEMYFGRWARGGAAAAGRMAPYAIGGAALGGAASFGQ